MLPSAMARIAARSGDDSKPLSAASAERPLESTASKACAAPASAAAPGAQVDLAKPMPQKSPRVGKIPHRHGPAPRPLHLGDSEGGAGAAGNPHEIAMDL